MSEFDTFEYDAIVIGAGHAGVESALALSGLGRKTCLMTLSLDAIAFMACNPNIGGTAKGHLVREIDALGGQMALTADECLLQLRMLNSSKGSAVHSLRGQTDKILYHNIMKRVVENKENLTVVQEEAVKLLVNNGSVEGVITKLGSKYSARAVIIAAGVYLDSDIVIGEHRREEGPGGFARAHGLTASLIENGLSVRRFKTGTPARVHSDSIDYDKMVRQDGDSDIYAFSFMNDTYRTKEIPCYLTYTNEKTHEIIRNNIHRSPLYNGSIKSIGPRYCPSIEDKVMRFKDKTQHQIFIEPESLETKEMYVQGMSSSLPHDVQLEMYRSIKGLEHCHIMRYAYAIEYDCIDSTQLTAALMVKHIKGLFAAGQINGSSGYEEAAAQGLMAGINAHLFLNGFEPLIIGRDEGYIGVLIDDLVTKGTNEPYRMMTARAEYRLNLRQENADLRLTEYGRRVGLVSDERYSKYLDKKAKIAEYTEKIKAHVSPKLYAPMFDALGESVSDGGLSFSDMLKRGNIDADALIKYFPDTFLESDRRTVKEVEALVKYSGYLDKQNRSIDEMKKLENKLIPDDVDYSEIKGLRLEARDKLNKIRPRSLGQASRISGVSPADITVLMVMLFK